MALNITRGVIPKAQKVVIYGPEGVGKTTFAAQFPNPLFIDTEGGTESYDVARTDTPQSWEALLDQVREVAATKPCSTLVLDTADWAETLASRQLCAKRHWEDLSTPDFGKGPIAIEPVFSKLLDALSDVVDAGMNVVITCHSIIGKFDRPDEAQGYNRYEMKLTKYVNPKVKEWADTILFFNYKVIVETVGSGFTAKGKARGKKRMMYTEHDAVWDAKNRWGLPAECPMDYSVIAPYIPDFMAQATQQPTPAVQAADDGLRSAVPLDYVEKPTEPAPAQAESVTPTIPDSWTPAVQLMQRDGITIEEVAKVAAAWGHFTIDTPPENYPAEYITGCLVPNWGAVKQAVDNIRFNEIEVPFN